MKTTQGFAEFIGLKGQGLTFKLGGSARASTGPKGAVDAEGGDYKSGLITNVVLCQVGEARGWGWNVEQEFIDKVAEFANAKKDGLKSRYEHPEFGKLTLGSAIAAIKNVRVEGDMAIGDMHILQSATKSPLGDLGGYVVSLANERPDFFGLSIFGSIEDFYFYNETGERVNIRTERDYLAYCAMPPDTKLYISLASLDATDAVDEGALTDSLFAASVGNKTPKPTGKVKKAKASSKTTNLKMKKKRLAFDINATTESGESLRIATDETKPVAGNEVFTVDDESGEEEPAPDGEYTIADGPCAGMVITVAEGQIETVTEPESDENAEASEGDDNDENVEANEGDKPGNKGTVKMSAGEQAIMKELKQMAGRIQKLEKTPLAQHANPSGGDTYQGNSSRGGDKKVAFEREAEAREKEAKAGKLPTLPSWNS